MDLAWGAEWARSGGPRSRYAIGSLALLSSRFLDLGTSSTDHGHAVLAREYQTDSSSKRPAPLPMPGPSIEKR